MKINILSCVLIIYLFLAVPETVSLPQSKEDIRKVNLFKQELYKGYSDYSPPVILKNTEIKDPLVQRHLQNIYRYNSQLGKALYKYLSFKNIAHHMELKRLFHHGFLYQDSPGHFTEFIKITEVENTINKKLESIIVSDVDLARLEIFYKGRAIFQKAFKVIDGFEAYLDIDQFRKEFRGLGDVLENKSHGDAGISKNETDSVKIWQNNILYGIRVPVIYKNVYLADISYEFYK